ncbi:MAG: hypothetical protein EYC67_09875 [Betaproteobacteria bacterium]|nr:MAG: hypothetical protein EYC67_09875 [Betaproteobacteria bacterium]
MHFPVVILASSRKNGGICLAGRRLDGAASAWVRPVSRLAGQSWPRRSLQILAGGVPGIGDRISLPIAASCPEGHQRENVGVRFEQWQRQGRIDVRALPALLDMPETLWRNGWHSVHGWNDRVPGEIAAHECRHSLLLVRPQALHFRLSVQGSDLVLRAAFVYRGERHVLRVTDEQACQRWLARLADGHSGCSDALLCLSLGLPFNGYCYKLVAGVIEPGAQG